MNQYLPKPYKKRRFYNKSEVEQHSTPNDLWVSFFNLVFDYSQLIQANRQCAQVEPLIEAAGTDITHWFDQRTRQPRTRINQKGEEVYYVPMGEYLDLSKTKDIMSIPWWKNQKYCIGKLTRKSRPIRIINTLSDGQDTLFVPVEQTINEILDRYEQINAHARSYTWKRKGKVLDMSLTLTENGIEDQSELYKELEVPESQQYIPAIHIHFNDDLTSK